MSRGLVGSEICIRDRISTQETTARRSASSTSPETLRCCYTITTPGGALPASSITLDNAKVVQYESATIDDFDDNKVKGWEKFDFGTGNGFFKEKVGQFTVGMHKPTRQQFFVAATHKEKDLHH